jgi:hypothetical protein
MLLALVFPVPALGQSISVLALPRVHENIRQEQAAQRNQQTLFGLTPAAKDSVLRELQIEGTDAVPSRAKPFYGWAYLRSEEPLADIFWENPRILPLSSLALRTNAAAIYTEIGVVPSGPWRFSVGTTIAAAEENKPGNDQANQDTSTAAPQPDTTAAGQFLSGDADVPRFPQRVVLAARNRPWLLLPSGLISAANIDLPTCLDGYERKSFSS